MSQSTHNARLVDPLKSYATQPPMPLGTTWFDDQFGALMVLVKNAGAAVIPAKMAAVCATTDRVNGYARLGGTVEADQGFAGIRPVGADDLAAAGFGAIQISGPATGLFTDQGSAVACSAGLGVTVDSGGAGRINGQANTGLGAAGSFGIGWTATSTPGADVSLTIQKSVYR